jgi:hypothetical protein
MPLILQKKPCILKKELRGNCSIATIASSPLSQIETRRSCKFFLLNHQALDYLHLH